MQELIEKIIRNLSEFFKGLDANKKIGVVALIAFILVGLVGVSIWASKTRYATLYTDLNKEDSKQIARLLEDKAISYQISQDGKTIKVPEEMVNQWRLELATMGVEFSGTVGYEVFDKQSFGTTSFVQKVNRQRALEGELVKTIKVIKGIKRARVHLSIPEQSPFVTEKKPPAASVVLEFDRGVTLTPEEIKGIGSLIASSVDGMRSEAVVILDSRGKKLSENSGDSMSESTANRMALEQKLNRGFEDKIQDILGRVVGDGKVMAKVNVVLDDSEQISTQTTYDNENAAVLSEVKNTQKLEGSRPSPQGIPGSRSNVPGEEPQAGVPETRNNVDKELTTRNFEVPTKIVKAKKPSAVVSQINVAVMIDGKRVPALNAEGVPLIAKDGKPVVNYQKWSDADLQNFSQIVASSLGIDDRRGDKLVIKNMEFAQEDLTAVDAMMKEQANREMIKNIVKYAAVGLIISLFFFFVIRPFVQWITDNTVESVEDFLPRTLEELEKVQANQKLPGLEDALPQIEEKLNPEKIEGNMLREKIISLVENNPGKAAQVIHEMIHNAESDRHIA